MASEESSSFSSTSSSEADSYIGSLISLTSKSEIRYQGILISIKPQESTIALHNVRSYGTEGRKKDGPQIPPSEKVYEYILFRGSDIKDLQVKSSPSLHTKTLQHNDPAIIQSQYTYAPVTHASSASLGDGTLAGPSPHATHPALARTTIPDAYSLYQTGSHLGSWVPSPVPTSVTGTSLATPMYVQSYVGDSSGQAHTPLQSVSFQSQPMINQVQYPEIHAPTSIMSLPEVTSSTGIPSQFAVPGPAGSSMPLSSNISLLPQSSSLLLSHLSTVSSHESSNQELNMMNLASSKPSQTSFLPVSSLPFSPSSISGSTSGPLTTLPLLTPDPLAVPAVTSSLQKLYPEPREIGNLLPSSADLPSSFSMVPQEPLLPLPLASQQNLQELQGVTQFNEEFDFMTMNEKFNKDEVWGSLGKAKERVTIGDETEDPLHENLKVQEGNVHDSRIGSKPVYNKDDFFDTLSCNSLNRGGWTGRTRFSERMKLDTETFGEFQQRPPMGRGNHEPAYGGNFRSSYNRGRGYEYYGGRGRGGYRPI